MSASEQNAKFDKTVNDRTEALLSSIIRRILEQNETREAAMFRVPNEWSAGLPVRAAGEWGLVRIEAFIMTLNDAPREQTARFQPPLTGRYLQQYFIKGYMDWFEDDSAKRALGQGLVVVDGTVRQSGPTNTIFQRNRSRPQESIQILKSQATIWFEQKGTWLERRLRKHHNDLATLLHDLTQRRSVSQAVVALSSSGDSGKAKAKSKAAAFPLTPAGLGASSSSESKPVPYRRAGPSASKMVASPPEVRQVQDYRRDLWPALAKNPQDYFEFTTPRMDEKESGNVQMRVASLAMQNREVMYANPEVGSYDQRSDAKGLTLTAESWVESFGSGKWDQRFKVSAIGFGADNEILEINAESASDQTLVRGELEQRAIPSSVIELLLSRRAVIRRPRLSHRQKEQQVPIHDKSRWVRWHTSSTLIKEATSTLEMASLGMGPYVYGMAVEQAQIPGPHQGTVATRYALVTILERGEVFSAKLMQIRGAPSTDPDMLLTMRNLLKLVVSYSACRIYVLDSKPDNLVVRIGTTEPLLIDMDHYYFRYANFPAVPKADNRPFGDWKVMFFVNMMLLSMMLKMFMHEKNFRSMWWTKGVDRVLRSVLTQVYGCSKLSDANESGLCAVAEVLSGMKLQGNINWRAEGRAAAATADPVAIQNTVVELVIHYTIVFTYSLAYSNFAKPFVRFLAEDPANSATIQRKELLRAEHAFLKSRLVPTARFFKQRLVDKNTAGALSLPAVMFEYLTLDQDKLDALSKHVPDFDTLVKNKESRVAALTGMPWAPA